MTASGANNDWQLKTLAGLVKDALVDLNNDWEFINAKAERIQGSGDGDNGLSQRNIEAYANGERKRLKISAVQNLSTLFTDDPETWMKALNMTSSAGPAKSKRRPEPFLTNEDILRKQTVLTKDDEVWYVSCKKLPEVRNLMVGSVVAERLQNGVAYKYFCPDTADSDNESTSHYGNDAWDTYRDFKEAWIHSQHFDDSPSIHVFRVSPAKCPYFSKLHSIVCYRKKVKRGAPGWQDEMYSYAEYEDQNAGGSQRRRAWYQLPPDVAEHVITRLESSRLTIGDEGMPHVAMNGRLRKIKTKYQDHFLRDGTGKIYEKVNTITSHAKPASEAILEVLGTHWSANRADEFRFLDIGCGDGTTTKLIAKGIDTVQDLRITLLDTSDHCVSRAQEALSSLGTVVPINKQFEDMEPPDNEKFDLITSVHSFYVIDEVFLRKAYELLAPGGLVAIWVGALKNNVFHQIANDLDKQFIKGQARNYAERILKALRAMGIDKQYGRLWKKLHQERKVEALYEGTSLNADGRDVARYFALTDERTEAEDLDEIYDIAFQAARKCSIRQGDQKVIHPLDDYLICFQKPS